MRASKIDANDVQDPRRVEHAFTQRDLIAACAFCERTPLLEERTLWATEHLYVLVGLGPIVEGYVIITTRDHVASFAELPTAWVAEYEALKSATIKLLRDVYGSYQLYEHGKAGTCFADQPGTQHCYHAHLNCVPTRIDVLDHLLSRFDGGAVDSYQAFRSAATRADGYLYYENARGRYVFPVREQIGGSYLRRLFCDALGAPERVDYIASPGYETVWSGRDVLRSALDDSRFSATEVR